MFSVNVFSVERKNLEERTIPRPPRERLSRRQRSPRHQGRARPEIPGLRRMRRTGRRMGKKSPGFRERPVGRPSMPQPHGAWLVCTPGQEGNGLLPARSRPAYRAAIRHAQRPGAASLDPTSTLPLVSLASVRAPGGLSLRSASLSEARLAERSPYARSPDQSAPTRARRKPKTNCQHGAALSRFAARPTRQSSRTGGMGAKPSPRATRGQPVSGPTGSLSGPSP